MVAWVRLTAISVPTLQMKSDATDSRLYIYFHITLQRYGFIYKKHYKCKLFFYDRHMDNYKLCKKVTIFVAKNCQLLS